MLLFAFFKGRSDPFLAVYSLSVPNQSIDDILGILLANDHPMFGDDDSGVGERAQNGPCSTDVVSQLTLVCLAADEQPVAIDLVFVILYVVVCYHFTYKSNNNIATGITLNTFSIR